MFRMLPKNLGQGFRSIFGLASLNVLLTSIIIPFWSLVNCVVTWLQGTHSHQTEQLTLIDSTLIHTCIIISVSYDMMIFQEHFSFAIFDSATIAYNISMFQCQPVPIFGAVWPSVNLSRKCVNWLDWGLECVCGLHWVNLGHFVNRHQSVSGMDAYYH